MKKGYTNNVTYLKNKVNKKLSEFRVVKVNIKDAPAAFVRWIIENNDILFSVKINGFIIELESF